MKRLVHPFPRDDKRERDTIIKALVIGLWLGFMVYMLFIYPRQARAFASNFIDPSQVTVEGLGQTFSITPTPIPNRTKEQIFSDLKVQAKAIFGSEWKTAIAVCESECNHARKDWPNCQNSWAKEHSIGFCQINLAQNEGKGRKVHWDKIPGTDLKAKEEWLRDPANNLIAAKIIRDRSGWEAWTAYTSKNYLNTWPK